LINLTITSRSPIPTPILVPKPILVPTPKKVLSPIDYMSKFMIPFIENIMDVKGDENCCF